MSMLTVRLLTLLALVAAPVSAQDPLTTTALKRIAQVEQLEPGLEAGDSQKAALYLNQLAWAGKRLNAVSNKGDSHWRSAKARYDALWQKLEAKGKAGRPAVQPGYDHAALVQLNKEVGAAFHNFGILSLKHLEDDFRVKSIRNEIADFRARLGAFPAADENVKIVTGNLQTFEQQFDAAMTRLSGDQAAASDVSARLEELRGKYGSANRPQDLSHPFSEPQLRAWATEMRRWRETELPTDLAWLETARANAAVDQQKVGSLRNWLGSTWPRQLDEVEKLVRERVASDVAQGLDSAEFVLETDLEDPHHIQNRILGKGRFDEQMTWLNDGLHAVAMAEVYDDAMASPAVMGPTITDPTAPRPEAPDRAAQRTKIASAVERMKRLAKLALDGVRLPEPASVDPELLKIAADTLARPEYEIAGWEALVINADKTRRVRREAWLKPGTTSIRLDYYEYVWDQYQVTTVEKVGDELWLFANLLKRYESGDPTTPCDKWILSRRFELTPILPEHAKD